MRRISSSVHCSSLRAAALAGSGDSAPLPTGKYGGFAAASSKLPAGKSRAEMAQAFVDQIAAFVKEVGLPSTFAELGIPADTDYRAIADSTQLTGGCPRKFDAEELYQILLECR